MGAAVLVSLMVSVPVHAVRAIDQFQTQAIGNLFINPPIAQTFTAGQSGMLDQVDVKLLRAGSPGPLTLEIRPTLPDGKPSNSVLRTATVPAAAVQDTVPAFVQVPLTPVVPSIAGTKYAIVLTASANAYSWDVSNLDPYPRGELCNLSIVGTWSCLSAWDAVFQTWVTTPTSPPTLNSTTPSSRGQGTSHQLINIIGTNFVNGATADFGAGITVNSTTFTDATNLTADISVAGSAVLGSRTITVTNPDYGTGSCFSCFTVTPPVLASLAVTAATSTLAKGLDSRYSATGTYTDGSRADLTAGASWASSNTAVATVSSTGVARAVGPGSTTISATVSTVNGMVTGTASLTVTPENLVAATGTQTYVVPAGVCSVKIDASGAQGGGVSTGGFGGQTVATVLVTPGQQFQVNVGGMGSAPGTRTPAGGFNGGGDGGASPPGDYYSGGGGGGGSDVHDMSNGLDKLIIVAGGGGGGGGGGVRGGAGGSPAAEAGIGAGFMGGGGGGGTQTDGGLPGTPGATSGNPGIKGGRGLGQAGGAAPGSYGGGGGGGGGGYFGGGGGGSSSVNGGGGGGGSGYGPPGAVFSTGRTGDGLVNISIAGRCKATPTLTTQATTTAVTGGAISDTATLAGGAAPTGTVAFNLYGPNNATCTGTPVFTSTVPISAGTATSAPYLGVGATYRWVASYSGDPNNDAVANACGDAGETSRVTGALDQSQLILSGNSVVGQGGYMKGQGFTAGLSGQLDQVDLRLLRTGATGDLLVQIRNVMADGTPSTSVLATGVLLEKDIPDTGGGAGDWYSVPFASPAPVVKDGRYAIVVSAPNSLCPPDPAPPGSSCTNYRWMEGVPDPYPGGISSWSPDGLTWYAGPYYDQMFKTYVVTGTVDSGTVPATGGAVTTSNPLSALTPVTTAVTVPTGYAGPVTIIQTATTLPAPTSFTLLKQQVILTAPTTYPGAPLKLVFSLDPSLYGTTPPAQIRILRTENGGASVPVPPCNGPPGVASPDPCVLPVTVGPPAQITVFTSKASIWNFAIPEVKLSPVISWSNPVDIVYGTPLSATQLNAVANVPGSFSYSPESGTVLHAGPGQQLKMSFTPTDPIRYQAATRIATINVRKAAQTINFEALTDNLFGSPPRTMSASASSGLPVTLSASGQCSVSRSTVTITGGGACDITASQAGNADYKAAPSVTRSFNIACLSSPMPFAVGGTGGSSVSATVAFSAQRPAAGGGCTGTFLLSAQIGPWTSTVGSGRFTATTAGTVVTASLVGSVGGPFSASDFNATLTLDVAAQTGTIVEVFATSDGPLTVTVTIAKVAGVYVIANVTVTPPPAHRDSG